jgi:hypothetical protein
MVEARLKAYKSSYDAFLSCLNGHPTYFDDGQHADQKRIFDLVRQASEAYEAQKRYPV